MKPLTRYGLEWTSDGSAAFTNSPSGDYYAKDEADAHFAEMEAKIVEATALAGNAIGNSEACERDLEMKDARIAELEPAAKWFGEVMAIMHGDGGHYVTKHGPEKSALDAVAKYHALLAERDAARSSLEATLADAERYRWLREQACAGQGEHEYERMAYTFEVLTDVSHVSHVYHHADLPSVDAAIDAARGVTKGNE